MHIPRRRVPVLLHYRDVRADLFRSISRSHGGGLEEGADADRGMVWTMSVRSNDVTILCRVHFLTRIMLGKPVKGMYTSIQFRCQ